MATSDALRARYFSNGFIDALRNEVRIDEADWQALKACLRDLAAEWRGVHDVDKDIVQDLFALPTIVRGVAHGLEPHDPERSKDLFERAAELEALILEALAS